MTINNKGARKIKAIEEQTQWSVFHRPGTWQAPARPANFSPIMFPAPSGFSQTSANLAKSHGQDKWQAENMSEQEVRNNCVLNAKNVKVAWKKWSIGVVNGKINGIDHWTEGENSEKGSKKWDIASQ